MPFLHLPFQWNPPPLTRKPSSPNCTSPARAFTHLELRPSLAPSELALRSLLLPIERKCTLRMDWGRRVRRFAWGITLKRAINDWLLECFRYQKGVSFLNSAQRSFKSVHLFHPYQRGWMSFCQFSFEILFARTFGGKWVVPLSLTFQSLSCTFRFGLRVVVSRRAVRENYSKCLLRYQCHNRTHSRITHKTARSFQIMGVFAQSSIKQPIRKESFAFLVPGYLYRFLSWRSAPRDLSSCPAMLVVSSA